MHDGYQVDLQALDAGIKVVEEEVDVAYKVGLKLGAYSDVDQDDVVGRGVLGGLLDFDKRGSDFAGALSELMSQLGSGADQHEQSLRDFLQILYRTRERYVTTEQAVHDSFQGILRDSDSDG